MHKRLDKLLDLHNRGFNRYQMVQYSAKHWGLSSRQTDTYRKALFDELKKDLETTREAKITEMITRLDHVYSASMQGNQMSNAIGALNSISRLLKLEA